MTELTASHATRYRPLGLLAEMTYRCPLHCPYCSNPTRYSPGRVELSTVEWRRVLAEAIDLGVLHVMFSGGEPLLRPDLPELVAAARSEGVYTNLITSAVGFTRERAERLKEAGLDSIQISFQADVAELADEIAGTRAHERKREAALLAREVDLPITVNVVVHRRNVDRLGAMIALAEEVGAERLELANVQFYGWAFRNKEALLPSRAQLAAAQKVAAEAQARLRGRMEVHFILPDYFADRPKPCMNGWGQRYLTVNPLGDVLPCPTAYEIKSLPVDNVRDHPLRWIWEESQAFNRFRGADWMPDPCHSCDRRDIDFGGCRCQAALLTGDPANADPVCDLSPHHASLADMVERLQASETIPAYAFRLNP
ncbi:MAG: pyrroloquinoline quinone biosynthesis protein PqqE [Capsulimonadaceae bacterium]